MCASFKNAPKCLVYELRIDSPTPLNAISDTTTCNVDYSHYGIHFIVELTYIFSRKIVNVSFKARFSESPSLQTLSLEIKATRTERIEGKDH